MKKLVLALLSLLLLASPAAAQNYTATAGAGLTFGAKLVGGVLFPQQMMCDPTTPAQCVAVNASGQITITNTSFASTQSGTWTVQPGNTANTTPWLFTGSGSAGSAAAGVVTVQGIASMTPLFVQSSTVPISTMNSTNSNSGVNAAASCNFDDTSPTTLTENNFGFQRCSANRNAYMTIRDAAGNERGVNVNASNQLAIAGPVTIASAGVASGAYASGAFSSGAFASGSYASGSFASGAMVDLLTFQGTKNAGTAAANSLLAGLVYNSTPLTLTNTQQSSLQSDANGYLKVNVAAGGAGGGAVYGPTAVGSPAANPPVLMAGTANATATGNVQVAKVDSAGTVYMDCVSGGTLCTALATGVGTPGSAPPANVIYMGVNGSGATGGQMKGVTGCDATAIYDASTNGSTELVALTSGRSVYICGYTILAGGTVNVKLITGTGTACATGSANVTPAFQLTAQVGAVDGSPFWRGLKGASAGALCINTSAGIAVQAIVYYSVI